MPRRRPLRLLGAPALVLALTLGRTGIAAAAEPRKTAPKDLGLVESAVTRLQQLDVTLIGQEADLQGITASDFEIKVGGEKLKRFLLDRVCQEPVAAASPPSGAAAAVSPSAAPVGAATFVFYFDHPHLTQAGRAAAIELAKDLVPKLVTDGNRAMVVSNAADLTTYVPLTDDGVAIVAALDRMRSDRNEWDPYAAQEEDRVADVQRTLGTSGDGSNSSIEMAVAIATAYQLEERWRQERDLRRLDMVLGRLADLDAPKAVVYFADTMRSNAGEHYLSFFGPTTIEATRKGRHFEDMTKNDAATASMNFDRVIDSAAALGVRFYTVEATGMSADSLNLASRSGTSNMRTSATIAANSQRHRDAQDSLASLAAETGGDVFLNGVAAPRVARKIAADLSCVYLVSFDPAGFRRDQPLAVKVKVKRPGIRVQVRGRTIIQGDSARLTSRLLATFAAPEASRIDVPLRIGLVPLGYRGGVFIARVQVVVPGSPVAGSAWDVGASLVSRGQVREDVSERVELQTPGVRVVLEKEMRFAAGPYELVAVAHESRTDRIGARKIEGSWASPDEKLAMVGPIALLQPASAAFLRGGAKHVTGNMVVDESDPVRADLPAALVGIVCRAKDQRETLRVERVLIGETETTFPPTEMAFPAQERCAQVRDLIPAATLGEGRYRYRIRISDRSGVLAEAERILVVPGRPAP